MSEEGKKESESRNTKGLTTEEITKQLLKDAKKAKEQKGVYIVKTANEIIEQTIDLTAPAKLFDSFWHEGEFCVLYAYTGIGKSILAVQMGESIASGIAIPGFQLEALAQKVLYFDYELSDRQFTGRYSEKFKIKNEQTNHDQKKYRNPYRFSPNFYWIKTAKNIELPEGTNKKEFIFQSIEIAIQDTGAKIIIIDNMTALAFNLSDKTFAQEFLEKIGTLQSRYELSVLMLGHTNKGGKGKEIDLDHLSGSMDIGNLIDSAFSIGFSNISPSHRYLIQMKMREDETAYSSNNVISVQINKNKSNFTGFQYLGLDEERSLLVTPGANQFDEKRAKARFLKEDGFTIDEIMKEVDISKGLASKYTRDITKRKGRNKKQNKSNDEPDPDIPY